MQQPTSLGLAPATHAEGVAPCGRDPFPTGKPKRGPQTDGCPLRCRRTAQAPKTAAANATTPKAAIGTPSGSPVVTNTEPLWPDPDPDPDPDPVPVPEEPLPDVPSPWLPPWPEGSSPPGLPAGIHFAYSVNEVCTGDAKS